MNRLEFRYRIHLQMDAPVHTHHFTLRCLPCENACQSVERQQLHITPNDYLAYGKDQWNNPLVYGLCKGAHSHFSAEVSGIVRTGLSAVLPEPDEAKALPFRYATPLTAADAQLLTFAQKHSAMVDTPYAYADRLMHALHSEMCYCPGSTRTSTTAAEAFQNRAGVCQDYAHIMLAVLRLRGIAARYVVGIIPGEGASHAWVDAWLNGAWYAFDPTNDTQDTDRYITFSHGRDYRDCEINRGVFRGLCTQNTEIIAEVNEAGGSYD